MSDEKTDTSNFRVTDRRGEADQKIEKDEPPKESSSTDASEKMHNQSMPKIDFATFVLSLSTSALVHLGLIEDPQTKQKTKNIEVARQEIDLIEMLKEKTQGNLNSTEEKILEDALYQLRLSFVEQSRS